MAPILGIIASSQTASTLTAFESIATATGTGSSGTITFSSIPSTYQHLQIRILVRDTSAGTIASTVNIRMGNGTVDTTSIYPFHRLYGTGSSALASGNNSNTSIGLNSLCVNGGTTADIHGTAIIDIHDYASTSKYKTVRTFGGQDRNGSGEISLYSGLFQSTSAVNIIQIYTSNNFASSSTFALYGIKGA